MLIEEDFFATFNLEKFYAGMMLLFTLLLIAYLLFLKKKTINSDQEAFEDSL